MGFDEEYLEDLLKSIEPIIYPEGRPDADDVPEMPEEELASRIAEPQESVVYEEEELEDEVAPADEPEEVIPDGDSGMVSIGGIELDPADGNKQLSADEIAALFAAADSSGSEAEKVTEPVAEEPGGDSSSTLEYDSADGNKVLSADEISALFAAANGTEDSTEEELAAEVSQPEVEETEGDLDIMALLGETGESEPAEMEINLEGMSEEEIDAMLNEAKASDSDDIGLESDDDLMSLLAAAGDENLEDIQSLLDSDANGEAVDEAAFMAATVSADDSVESQEDAKARKKREKAEAKAAKKAKKKKGADDAEGLGDDIIIDSPKKGIFSRIIAALTESDEDENEREIIPIDLETGEAAIDISDENRDILAELDGEKGKKKAKKSKKKDKKSKKGEAPEGETDDEGEESGGRKKKAKKPKKPKKSKEVKEKEPSRPEKRLPKKRVKRVMLLGASIAAAILIAVFGITKITIMQEARWAFDNQDYQTVYEDLYGMKLSGSDAEIFNKSQTIMSMDRKLESCNNYQALGMRREALSALLDAVADYPSIRENAVKYGVEAQVDYTYSQIVAALGNYGLTESDAKEIVGYDSKVKYTKRVNLIANGTPFDYDDGSTVENEPENSEILTVDDILPEENDFLPDNPEDILEVDI